MLCVSFQEISTFRHVSHIKIIYIIKDITLLREKIMKKMVIFIACLLVTINIFSASAMKNAQKPTTGNSGWLETRDGVRILHVSGSNYEMGYQHGSLLKEEVSQDIRAFLNYSHESKEYLLSVWNQMQEYIPQDSIDEMHGMADGAEISFDDLAAANIEIIIGHIVACFGISAWGNATVDGQLYQTRSFDQPLDISDPETGTLVHDNAVLIIRNPENGYASIAPSFAGSMHGGGGFNSQGIAVGQQALWSKDYSFHGAPGQIRVQEVLDHATTAQQAIDILTTNKDVAWNFIVSDSKIPAGYAVEVTGNYSYVGSCDTPTESLTPFWSIPDVVRRTNFFIDPTLAGTQREKYDPSGLLSFLKLVKRTDVFFAVWRSYKVVSEGIERNYGKMDLNSTMKMMRACYSGKTDFLLHLIVVLAEGTSFNRAWNLWVADPKTGDIVVCFAKGTSIAFENPVHYFNFFTLLNETPPFK
jgi:Acyl-coenzyme A:6-aminopenicillanic acid acyl-transferase